MEPNSLTHLLASSHTRPCRVVQWATGTIGTRSLRAVIEHPGLDLAGVYVHSADKKGRDAGELCGLTATGVRATDSIDEILSLGADCVLYMPLVSDIGEVCTLLAAGLNVVTTGGGFHHPASMDPVDCARVETACWSGGTSLHSTGSSPGFITEAVPLLLASIQRRLDGIMIDEYADLSQRDSPELLFDIMGFGRAPGDIDEYRLEHARTSFGPSLRLVADALSLPLDSVEVSGELATVREDVPIAAGVLSAGTVGAQRTTVFGMRHGEPLLSFRATWYCSTDLVPSWNVRATGWHIALDGDAPLDIDLRFPVPLEHMREISPSYTANRAVNVLPFVCSAAPGIRTTLELPQIISNLG
ncbi:NAD(P)H-dependent amine dehydrogenase family protein [Nocardia callitridis]|uniref:Dihydrodipicolinate reductase n=1 Tax=Nocardia callitridis TaxID=648753 RepID=A0ABP9KAH7_9NOCA